MQSPFDSCNPIVKTIFQVVVAIVALYVLSFVWLVWRNPTAKNKVGAAAGDIGACNSALALYQVHLQAGRTDTHFPTASLCQLVSNNAKGWAGPYMATITKDPWDNAYTYTSNGNNYTIQSVHESEYHRSETIRYVFSAGVMESIP